MIPCCPQALSFLTQCFVFTCSICFYATFFVFAFVFCSCTLIVLEHVCRPSLLCNARCNPFLLTKIDNTRDFSLIAITESWLHDHIYNNAILSTGYTTYRKDRCSKGGGVMLAVKSIFICTQFEAPDNLEIVTISVHSRDNLTICAVYLLPNYRSENIQDLYSYITTLTSSASVVLMGDFNSSDIDWQLFASSTVSSDHLCDLIIDHNLFQLVDVPIHIYGNILDLIITSDTDLIDDLVVHWLFIGIGPFYNNLFNLSFFVPS